MCWITEERADHLSQRNQRPGEGLPAKQGMSTGNKSQPQMLLLKEMLTWQAQTLCRMLRNSQEVSIHSKLDRISVFRIKKNWGSRSAWLYSNYILALNSAETQFLYL